VEQGEAGFQIYVEQVEQKQGGLKFDSEPLHLCQSGSTRPWNLFSTRTELEPNSHRNNPKRCLFMCTHSAEFGSGSRSNSNFRGWEWRDSGAACFSKLVRSDACCLLASPMAKDCVGTALTCLQIVTWTAILLDLASESSRLSARWWWIGHRFNLISGPNSPCDPDRAFISLCLPPSSAIAVFSCSWSPFVCIYSLPVGGSAKIDPPSERESCRRYNAACGAVDEEARG
jgi:hypothetical protein